MHNFQASSHVTAAHRRARTPSPPKSATRTIIRQILVLLADSTDANTAVLHWLCSIERPDNIIANSYGNN